MTAGFDPGMNGAMSVLRRITTRPPPDPDLQTCDMCAEPIGDDHPHVVDIHSRQLMCACRGCWLLFTAENADLRYKAVPDRYLSFPDFSLTQAGWDGLDIPVGLVFFFSSSVLGRTVAFYPGPAGVAESELGLQAWSEVLAANPELEVLTDDVEALLVRAPDADRDAACFLYRSTPAMSLPAGCVRSGAGSTEARTPARRSTVLRPTVAERSQPARDERPRLMP